jgi:hypothetical protein
MIKDRSSLKSKKYILNVIIQHPVIKLMHTGRNMKNQFPISHITDW